MSPLMDLRIDAALDGRESEFARAMEVREQHWSGRAGKGGDVRPSSSLNEVMIDRSGDMCERLITEHGWSEADFRYAAGRLEASGDPDLEALGRHLRAMELYAIEEFEREAIRMENATESMTQMLIDGQNESYLREQRTPIGNRDSKRQHPAQRAPLAYPVNITPMAEDIDPDRAARGARSASFSQRLRSLAQEVAGMAKLSSSPRQRARLLRRSQELERMAVTQFEREGQSEIIPSGDPTEFNNVVSGAARDLDAKARANGAQDGDFDSFDDWDDGPRLGSGDAVANDVDAQLEDVPCLPPGKRVSDELGGQRKRYSAFGKESLREGTDLTAQLLEDMRLHWAGSHSFF